MSRKISKIKDQTYTVTYRHEVSIFQIIFEPQDIEHVTGAVLPYLESEPVLIEVRYRYRQLIEIVDRLKMGISESPLVCVGGMPG